MKKKRIFAVLLAIVVLAALAVPAWAAPGDEEGTSSETSSTETTGATTDTEDTSQDDLGGEGGSSGAEDEQVTLPKDAVAFSDGIALIDVDEDGIWEFETTDDDPNASKTTRTFTLKKDADNNDILEYTADPSGNKRDVTLHVENVISEAEKDDNTISILSYENGAVKYVLCELGEKGLAVKAIRVDNKNDVGYTFYIKRDYLVEKENESTGEDGDTPTPVSPDNTNNIESKIEEINGKNGKIDELEERIANDELKNESEIKAGIKDYLKTISTLENQLNEIESQLNENTTKEDDAWERMKEDLNEAREKLTMIKEKWEPITFDEYEQNELYEYAKAGSAKIAFSVEYNGESKSWNVIDEQPQIVANNEKLTAAGWITLVAVSLVSLAVNILLIYTKGRGR
jgi:hypothetical protein